MKKASQVKAVTTRSRRDRASDAPGRRMNDAQEAGAFREEDVRRRAYEIYEARQGDGTATGDAESDWFAAEKELKGLSLI